MKKADSIRHETPAIRKKKGAGESCIKGNGSVRMLYEILKLYMVLCDEGGIEPSYEGLNAFNCMLLMYIANCFYYGWRPKLAGFFAFKRQIKNILRDKWAS